MRWSSRSNASCSSFVSPFGDQKFIGCNLFEERRLDNARWHSLARDYRHQVWKKYGITPLVHQAEWMVAAEGYVLTLEPPKNNRQPSILVKRADGYVEPRALLPRPGGGAHVLADLAGFKSGKSFSIAMFGAGFAGVPNARVDFVGLEYDTSEPEFGYLEDFLLSERGMNLNTTSHRNNKKEGAIWMTLENGAHFEVKSWRAVAKSDSMKGKKRHAYLYTEAYQLPGLHVYSRYAQNLRELDGWAVFATTPDRAWVREMHDKAHGKDPYWHCTCDIDASCNPHTFDQAARDRDDPDKGGMMTRERFQIAWGGKVNRHIGAVYDYDPGVHTATPFNYPQLWTPEGIKIAFAEADAILSQSVQPGD